MTDKETKTSQVINQPKFHKVDELTHAELMELLSNWRKKIIIEELDKDAVHLEVYLVLVADELFRRINSLRETISNLEKKLNDK